VIQAVRDLDMEQVRAMIAEQSQGESVAGRRAQAGCSGGQAVQGGA
jgi:hypothetical protein